MQTRKSCSPAKFNILILIGALGLFLPLVTLTRIQSTEASWQEPDAARPKNLSSGIPVNVPLKQKVKNLDSKNWVHDLEVEVENTSSRPIYFMHFFIILPEIKGPQGKNISFWLKYGRGELLDFSTPLQPTDIPIKPGETYTFKITESDAKGWEHLKEKEGKPEPTRIILVFQGINFGDGTGFADANGTPLDIHKKINLNKSCVPPPIRGPESGSQLFSFYRQVFSSR